MSPQPPQWTDFLLCSNCSKVLLIIRSLVNIRKFIINIFFSLEKEYSTADNDQPVTLPVCGHSICRGCIRHVQNSKCKFEQNSPPIPDLSNLPVNYALLQLVVVQKQEKRKFERPNDSTQVICFRFC